MHICQLAVGGMDHNFSYVIIEPQERQAVVIDPCGRVSIIMEQLRDSRATTCYILVTHGHRDHTEGIGTVRDVTGAPVLCHRGDATSVGPDRTLEGGEKLQVGGKHIGILHTPGHTPGSISIVAGTGVITGDTLFVGYCGRTDGPGGSAEDLYHSLFDVLAGLPDPTRVYPGHDYGVRPVSTIGEEKATNPYYACTSKEAFVALRRRGV